jgi:hypothetical protein
MVRIELQRITRAFGGNGFTHWYRRANAEGSHLNFAGALHSP